jgi:hypothetical protein
VCTKGLPSRVKNAAQKLGVCRLAILLRARHWLRQPRPQRQPGPWQVCGNPGEHELRAEGHTQAEAWHRACQLTEVAGLLAPVKGYSAPSQRWNQAIRHRPDRPACSVRLGVSPPELAVAS